MNSRRFGLILVLSLALIPFQFATLSRCFAAQVRKTVDPSPQVPERGKLPSALISLNAEGSPFARYAMLVDKKLRTLMIWETAGDRVKFVSAFGIDVGAKPGDKQKQGDHRTPEGIYFIQNTINGRHLDWEKYGDRSFTLDYPNACDRLEKKTGGGIWLHAVSDKTSLRRGSRGCIVVRNTSIAVLEKYVELKRTPVIVLDSVEYLGESAWREGRNAFKAAIETLKENEISGLQLFNLRNQIVARYSTPDKATHILYALKTDRGLKIVNEN